MLKYLHIDNIAVIESADIEPLDSFNVLTGETGAGKSIVIDSINAVLGERTYKEIIRNSADSASITAVFGDLSAKATEVLRENGLTPDENGNICVRRVLSQNGNGSIRINGQLTTAQVLRDISKYLINIHGQHDSQMLLRPENHYMYLDLLASNEKERVKYHNAFNNFTDIRRKIKELETDEDKKYDRIDLRKYQIAELENADIKVGELDELKRNREIINNAKKVRSALEESLHFLEGGVDENGADSLCRSALQFLEKSSVEELNSTVSELATAQGLISSAVDKINKYLREFSFSKEDAEKIDERLDLLHRLMLKYGKSEELMLDFLSAARNELAEIEFSDEKLTKLEKELEVAENDLIDAGNRLTNSRRKAADDFAKQVCENLRFMDMQSVDFIVDIKDSRYSKTGKDSVEFLISANAGESVKPLSKVASGGELSRIMLAIKSIIADKDDVDTLIFDEIDTGISGRAASKVAVQLKKVARLRQVICVTHLAQIAAAAEGHFLIEKNVVDNRTYTNVTLLNDDDRINEIARIMSGTELTENTINSAKELLDRSK